MRRSILRFPLHLSLLLVGTLALGACAGAGAQREIPPGEHVGLPLQDGAIVALSDVSADPAAFAGRTILVEADVRAVCPNAGCWMQIQDGDAAALVRWETGCGGAYAFPREAVGKRVLVQALLFPDALSEDARSHVEAEEPGLVLPEGEIRELNASAVVVLAEG